MKKTVLALALCLALLLSLAIAQGEENRTLTLYWNDPDAHYETCDIWIWFPGKDGSGHLFEPCDYGVKCVVQVPDGVEEVGFIVRKDCSSPGGSSWGSATKDVESDRFALLTGKATEIYLRPGDAMQYTSPDGGVTLNPVRSFKLAGIISPTQIRYAISPAVRLEKLSQVRVRLGAKAVGIEEVSSLNNKVNNGIITLKEPMDLSQVYTVEIDGYGEVAAVPTGLFDSEAFNAAYTYDGDDLGAVIREDKTVFKLWAPTASAVTLNLFREGNGGEAYETVGMTLQDRGIWAAEADCGHGTYYTYTVQTAAGAQEAVDPYAKAVGVNGDRGMVVDLRLTDPEGFRESCFDSGLSSYADAVIWEVHVRDFSNRISSSAWPGKYLAFTETGLTNEAGQPVGVDYLKQLGITHVHLQPVYDYATVDETGDGPQFNWGYDPKNYNAPEGSYSTDPYHGEVRIREFKQMVQALHENGIGVVMDVVYNHTYSLDSCLNRVVPYYYYRFNADGSAANGSGCGNETASERAMCRKYIVDSVRYWAEEYQLDGFRFDLMALHDLETMQAVEAAVHAVNPKALIYGEGWTGGTSPLRDALKASQSNIRQITPTGDAIGGIAVFNDAIRDGLKGSVFDPKDTGYANGASGKYNADRIIFGIQGGMRGNAVSWGVDGAMVINYVSSHDNHTLWDKLAISTEATEEARMAMNRLCAATVFLSRGTPFFLAGEEMLRSKQGDSNSYRSSDEVNNLDWESLTPGSAPARMSEFYGKLIALRREFSFLREGPVPVCDVKPNQTLEITWSDGEGSIAFAVINPLDATLTVAPPAGWEAYQIALQGEDAPVSQLSSGEFQVMPRSATLIVRTASASPSKESIPAMSAEETEARSEEPVLAEAAGDRLDAENNHRVFYEIFVGSFSDSDGDGVGDLRGIINRMDYLNDGDPASGKSLGVEGLWLTPIFSSPSYHKYNVTDYYTIDPVFGTEEDLRELIALCHARDVKLILDLPLNHTGSDHRWYKQFLNAHQMDSTDNIYYDLYSWIGPDETPPAGRHFSSVPRSDLKVETNFSDSMPELNFDSDSVRQEALNIARYYLDMGVDGFRFDAAKYLYLGEHEKNIEFWTWYIRELKKINPNVYTVAEVWDGEGVTNRYAAAVNCFNFSTSQAEGIIAETAKGGNVNAFASAMESTLNTLAAIRPDAMNIPFISNHDTDRAAGYLTMASGRMQMAASLYLLTPGSPFIYYGEEIGLRGSRGGANTDANRRLAMRWGDGDPIQDPAGSTYDKQTPYTVQDLENMPGSLLRHYRKLLKIRKDNPEIARGTFTALSFPDSKAGGFLCSWNGSTVAVLHNTTEKTQKLDLKAACDLPFTAIAAVVEALYGEGGAELDGTVLTLYPQTTVVLR